MSKYECGYCGKKYDAIDERMKCESKCAKDREKRAKLEELSKNRSKLKELNERKSDLHEELDKIESEIECLERVVNDLSLEEFITNKTNEAKPKEVYKINSKTVSGDEFYKAIEGIIKRVF